jgi:outer membrane biogenesis lipoprotein LolB
MAQMRCLLLVAASALLAACTAANEPLESSRGTAVRIVDDMDAL